MIDVMGGGGADDIIQRFLGDIGRLEGVNTGNVRVSGLDTSKEVPQGKVSEKTAVK